MRPNHPVAAHRPLRTARLAVLTIVLAGAALPLAPGRAPAQEPVPPAPADTVEAERRISARGAFLRSLVLPGWGQAYVGSPGRGAVYFALEAGSLWMVYKTRHQLDEARAVQAWMRETGQLGEEERLPLLESREEQFEDWMALAIFLLLFSGADAYVAAQLADFDEHVGVRPGAGGEVRLEARVPVGRRR